MSARGEPLRGEICDAAQLEVAVLTGGRSGERDVALTTARGVASALRGESDDRLRERLPRAVREIEIDERGFWRVGAQSLAPEAAVRLVPRETVLFLCLHGGDGENGTLQGFLESAGRVYTGSGVRASALCMDKQATRALAAASSVRIAPGLCMSAREWRRDEDAALERLRTLADDGWVIKPRCGGSSVATGIAREWCDVAALVDAVWETGDELLVEARVDGVELSCGVLGPHDGDAQALMPIEIRPAAGRFFDYEQKYSPSGAAELCPPAGVGAPAIARVRELAERMHRVAGCDGYSRSDWIVPADGEPVLLEINTLPGLTPRSLLPQEAAYHGASYTELCLRILAHALARKGLGR